MQRPDYYRAQAERSRRLARSINHPDVIKQLQQMARDYDDIVDDLEVGAIEIRHPELMPQTRR